MLPKGPPRTALIGRADLRSGTKDSGEELTPRPVPGCRAAANIAIKAAEVLLNLTEVCEQLTGSTNGLGVPFPDRRGVQTRRVTSVNVSNLSVDLRTLPVQRGESNFRICSSTGSDLAEQITHRKKTTGGTEKFSSAKAAQKLRRSFDSGGRLIVRDIDVHRIAGTPRPAGWIRPAQPPCLRIGPLGEISLGSARVGGGPATVELAEFMKVVIQLLEENRSGKLTNVWFEEHLIAKTKNESGVVCGQKPPCWMVAAQIEEFIVTLLDGHWHPFVVRWRSDTPRFKVQSAVRHRHSGLRMGLK